MQMHRKVTNHTEVLVRLSLMKWRTIIMEEPPFMLCLAR